MLENLYTTKMSANKKTLQNRFTKIRRESGRISKIMSAVMSCTVAAAMLGGAAVMAAVGSDGLEHFTKNEIYYKDGVKFTVNAADKNVPAWVYEDVAGEDGKIDVTVNRYQSRSVSGAVSDDHLIELSGEKGQIKLASNAWTMGYDRSGGAQTPDYLLLYPTYSEIDFIEFNNTGYSPESMAITALTKKNGNKFRRIEVYFAYDDNKELQTAFANFGIADKNDNPENMSFDGLQSETDLSYIGNFLTDYKKAVFDEAVTFNHFFTMYEDDYQNKKADGINFSIKEATEEGIIVSSDITLPQAEHVSVYVYNKDKRRVAFINDENKNTETTQFVLTPAKRMIYDLSTGQQEQVSEEDIPENQFVSGGKYRVCCIVLDKDYNLLYRWQEYVTLK